MDEEQLLIGTLRAAADRAPDGGLDVSAVRERARVVRRNRAALGTASAAALVAAVVLPLSLVVGDDRADGPDPAERPTVSDTANPEPTRAAAPAGRPDLGWSIGREITSATGPPFQPAVDASSGLEFARLGEHWFITSYGADRAMSLVDSTGQVLASFDGDGAFASAADGSAVAWRVPEGVMVLAAGATEPSLMAADLRGRPEGTPVTALRGGCPGPECEAYVSVATQTGLTTYLVTGTGAAAEPFLDGVLTFVSDVSPDGTLAAGIVRRPGYDEFCGGVVDIATREVLWADCPRTGALRFSPDGTRVLANDAFDGPNHAAAFVFDARSGGEEARYDGIVFEEDWEDDDSVLLVVGESGTELGRILRLDVRDGRTREVAPWSDLQVTGLGYRLEQR